MTTPWLCLHTTWLDLLVELGRRGGGVGESGAFLLGDGRVLSEVVYYDDLVPGCLDSGIIEFPARGFSALWDTCASRGLKVVGDVHTHRRRALQSELDRQNPMVAVRGHLAVIVPWYALQPVPISQLGLYEYLGDHHWRDFSGTSAASVFHLREDL